eukprot:TRINITY_DN20206_c0_g1_i1.p2 TRINITY_DN20206_c0_g1~~TRINITY_DN20206_c0_g1_i1.p2  ORF type:complete len:301 (+),score=81.36 TRINITY_DN20206_c0_g1_i1:85-987(+)
MLRFRELETLAQGSHGVVVKGLDTKTGKQVAIKKPLFYENEVPLGLIREVKLLQELKHENVVELIQVYASGGQVNVAYELVERGSLAALIADPREHLDTATVKGIVHMMLSGVSALHNHFIMHRDIKPDNILVSADGVLKLADFGLAKPFGESERSCDTPEVVTYPYRAPELFFGAYFYSPVIDCWSVGCCAVETWNRSPLFSPASELDALRSIASLVSLQWEGAECLPRFIAFKSPPADPDPASALAKVMHSAPPALIRLVAGLLEPDPRKRLSADVALKSEFFQEEPLQRRPFASTAA